ncbi:MAG: LysR family transcriptional regulator [Hyphomicrobiales bacterium]|nr:LysR family transcriptional regulator [Hyphomicrobiales bacterium]MCP5371691.1 LysR family transcriptional regulator [Hyphomicrobiales bacterium]
MDLADLRIFRAVVDEGGITRAAEKLHRVQSNVTTRVRQLEDDLGVDLFIRAGKRLHLAPAGRILVDYADRLLDLAEEAREAVRDPRPRGPFRLGAMESTAAVRLPAVLSDYHDRYPEVTLELRTGNTRQLAAAVLAGELDAALATGPLADAPFDQVPAFDEDLVIVSGPGHPALDGAGARPPTVLAFEDGCPHRKRLEDWFADRGEMPARIVELSSYHAMLGCVLAGMGISLLPRSVLGTFPEAGRLTLHPLPPGRDRARTVLFWRKGAESPKVKALADLLRA